jgi:hypothetical protein
LFLFDFEAFDEELVDVLGLFVAEVGAEVLHEFDDAVLAQVLVRPLLQRVVSRHRQLYYTLYRSHEGHPAKEMAREGGLEKERGWGCLNIKLMK